MIFLKKITDVFNYIKFLARTSLQAKSLYEKLKPHFVRKKKTTVKTQDEIMSDVKKLLKSKKEGEIVIKNINKPNDTKNIHQVIENIN